MNICITLYGLNSEEAGCIDDFEAVSAGGKLFTNAASTISLERVQSQKALAPGAFQSSTLHSRVKRNKGYGTCLCGVKGLLAS
jgi:hypothetical protein